MRLLKFDNQGGLTLTEDLTDPVPPYAILSHTWGRDTDEVTFTDLLDGAGLDKPGYAKIDFCGQQAKKDAISYFWVDTCCINKANYTELSEAITSMFRWYRSAEKCYVYLPDVSADPESSSVDVGLGSKNWASLRNSRWFSRGWTLQELLASRVVEFFSCEGHLLGTKQSLSHLICEITGIPIAALQGVSLSHYSVSERLQWAAKRKTKKPEDKAYCLLGIFDVYLPLIYGEGENAFVRLREAIDKRLSVAFRFRRHQFMPIDILDDLEHMIREYMTTSPEDEQCRIVVSGIGGQGKSETCLQLARRLRNRFWAVLWIDVSTEADAERSYLDMARKLSLHADSWEDALHSIANLKHPWLIILDNADDLSIDYSVYIPDGNPGVVILTSRNHECQQYASADTGSIMLDGLAPEDARDLLLKAARVSQNRIGEQKQETQTVVQLLQSHALALVQAGAYISSGHCTLGEYPQVYERRRHRLLGFRPQQAKSRYGDVYTTFEVSVDILRDSRTEAASDALQLLSMLAICGPTRLPLVLFEQAWIALRSSIESDGTAGNPRMRLLTSWHISHLPAFLVSTDTEWDSFRLHEAVRMLRTLSLITIDSENVQVFVSMHALVHAWARDRQGQLETHQSWLQMGCVMAFALAGDALSQQDKRQIQSHCELMTLWQMDHIYGAESSDLVTRILVICGQYLLEARADAHVLEFLHQVLRHLKLDLSQVDERYVDLYILIARSLLNAGKPAESVALGERLTQITSSAFDENDHYRLSSQRILAKAYYHNEQADRAVEIFEHVVQVEAQVLVEDHPTRLASQYGLANAYIDQGQASKALDLLEHVVEVRNRVLAEDHPDRLSSHHALANAYSISGQGSKAIDLLEHVVEVYSRVLGEDNPYRLISQHALAVTYSGNGQTGKAINLLEHVVEVRTRILAEDHPERLRSQHALADAYGISGQGSKAIDLLERVVEVHSRVLAEDHPERLRFQHALADLYDDHGRKNQAIDLLEHVVKVRNRALAEDHPERSGSQLLLAYLYRSNGQKDKSIDLYEHMVEVGNRTLGKDHPDVLEPQYQLACLYRQSERVSEAISLLEYVVEVRCRTLPEHDPDQTQAQVELATAYRLSGQSSKLISLLERLAEVRRQTLPEDDPVRLKAQWSLAFNYRQAGEVSKAIELMEHVVEVYRQVSAEGDHDRLEAQYELAEEYRLSGQLSRANDLFEHVVEVRGRVLARDDSHLVAAQFSLAVNRWHLGRHESAVKLTTAVVENWKRSRDEDDRRRQHAEEWLSFMQKRMTEMKLEAEPETKPDMKADTKPGTKHEIKHETRSSTQKKSWWKITRR